MLRLSGFEFEDLTWQDIIGFCVVYRNGATEISSIKPTSEQANHNYYRS